MNKKQQVAEKLASEARKGSPWSLRSVVLYILAFIYVLSPIDFIPDALLGFGQADDALVLIAVIFYAVRLLRRGK
ncbi:MAG: DUF1232 domain-containing protein [Akkermansia sp.]|nr:DUF1232 domain-containing protein [Akkermansia sp.]